MLYKLGNSQYNQNNEQFQKSNLTIWNSLVFCIHFDVCKSLKMIKGIQRSFVEYCLALPILVVNCTSSAILYLSVHEGPSAIKPALGYRKAEV